MKLSLIADAYFEIGDFDKRDMLIDAYNQLNSCLEQNLQPDTTVYVGLPIRDIVLKYDEFAEPIFCFVCVLFAALESNLN